MGVQLYSFVDMFRRGLFTAEGLLEKARSFASSSKSARPTSFSGA